MKKTIIYHKVTDFKKWKEVFDSVEPMRREAGELRYEVGTVHDDPSVVYVINEWSSLEACQSFFSNPKLAEAMQHAGVIEKPTELILDQLAAN